MTRRSRAGIALLSLLLSSLLSCETPQQIDPELSQAVASVRYMTTERWLSRSAFRQAYPDEKPSDYVSYLFSDFGVAEWPIALDEMEQEQLRSVGIPPLPPDVFLVPNSPDPKQKRQVVIRANDAEGTVIIEAYEDPLSPPVASVSRQLGS